jgi:inner membrane protein
VPTVFSHALFGAALYIPFRHHIPPRLALIGAAAAVVPDFDVVGFRFGIAYGHPLGHRGLSHSLAFAAVLAAVLTVASTRSNPPRQRWTAWFYLALATASHGVFDAFTNGGLGIALLAPFSNERFFFPWQPIEVSPLGLSQIFSARGLEVLTSELIWVGMPALAVALLGLATTRVSTSSSVRVPDN